MTFLEARLVIPSTPNPDGKGRTFEKIHDWHADYTRRVRDIESSLIRQFGGFTVTEGKGVWSTPDRRFVDEPVRVYTVAYESTPILRGRMDSIRDNIKAVLGQEAIYLSHTVLTGPAVT